VGWEARAARVCCDIPKEEVSTQLAQAGPDGQGEQALGLGWLAPMEYEKRHTTNVA
jgi:hypothetical protein